MKAVKKYDVLIVGAGPIGIASAISLSKLNLKIAIVDKQDHGSLRSPKADGREIALTHYSLEILNNLHVLQHIPKKEIFQIKEARILNGNESNFLQFGDSTNSQNKLAALISNHLIRKALYKEAITAKNIDFYTENEIEETETKKSEVEVSLKGIKKTLSAKLLIAADSRFSKIRQNHNINCLTRNIHKTMLVARINHSLDHHNIAYECFKYGKTIALLPLSKNISSVVITVTEKLARELLNTPEKTIEKYIYNNVGQYLGNIKMISKFHAFPLVCTYAEKFTGDKLALIGDAAVGMHPVTAHGMNFGLKGQNILAEEIAKALDGNIEINSDIVLNAYHNKHKQLTKLFFHFTNLLARIYTSESLPAKSIRSLFIRLANRVTPVKNFLAEKLH